MLSLIIPYRHSDKMYRRFIFFLKSIEAQKNVDLEIILVEYIDKCVYDLPSYIRRISAAPIKFIDNKPVYFHQSYLNNIGALNSHGDALLFTNADVIFEPGILEFTAKTLKKDGIFLSFFVWYTTPDIWNKIEKRQLDVVKDFEYIIQNSELNEQQAPRAAFQALRREDFDRLGGYDVDMWGWGAEEYEFYTRASKILKIYHSKEYKVAHLWHLPNWGPHHPRRGGINGANMKAVKHKKGVWRDPLTGEDK